VLLSLLLLRTGAGETVELSGAGASETVELPGAGAGTGISVSRVDGGFVKDVNVLGGVVPDTGAGVSRPPPSNFLP
jgi:hypothetical protein